MEKERSGTAEGGLTEEERQRAINLIAEAESRKHSVARDRGKFRTVKKEREKVSLVCLANVDEEEVQWLYCPYVPRAKLTLCAMLGNPASALTVLAGMASEVGKTIEDWKRYVFPHPTVGEIFREL